MRVDGHQAQLRRVTVFLQSVAARHLLTHGSDTAHIRIAPARDSQVNRVDVRGAGRGWSARYARSSGLARRSRIALGVAGVLALTGVVSYSAEAGRAPVTATVLGYQVASDHSVDVRFQVDNHDHGKPATCTVPGPRLRRNEVGRLDVPVRRGPATQVLSATIRTSERAPSAA